MISSAHGGFPDVPKAAGIDVTIVNSAPTERWPRVMAEGTASYKGREYPFRLSHEFDDGFTYIAYSGGEPAFHFMVHTPYDTDDPLDESHGNPR